MVDVYSKEAMAASEEIMEIYGLPDVLRESWRAIWRGTPLWMVQDWAVETAGYRLVIENGAMIGLACDEWPWGTPGPQRHLSAVGGCQTCCRDDPRPVHIPIRNDLIPVRGEGVLIYDMVLPEWPDDPPWTPFRNVFPRWHSGKICYPLPSGSMVHVKPDCRC